MATTASNAAQAQTSTPRWAQRIDTLVGDDPVSVVNGFPGEGGFFRKVGRARGRLLRRHVEWVLVADGARARLFRADRKAQRLELLQEEESFAARSKISELMTDRPGRAFESPGVGPRRGLEAPPSKKLPVLVTASMTSSGPTTQLMRQPG